MINDIFDVHLTTRAIKELTKVPKYIALKLQAWIDDVGHRGLGEVRKIPAYHDEMLKGKRVGQRSIRLSRSYRAIYIVDKNNTLRFIEIISVNKHDY